MYNSIVVQSPSHQKLQDRVPISLICVGFLAMSFGGCFFMKGSSVNSSVNIPTPEQKLGNHLESFFDLMSMGSDRACILNARKPDIGHCLLYLNDPGAHVQCGAESGLVEMGPVRWSRLPLIAYVN